MWISINKYFLRKIQKFFINFMYHQPIYVPYKAIWSQSRVSISSKNFQNDNFNTNIIHIKILENIIWYQS